MSLLKPFGLELEGGMRGWEWGGGHLGLGTFGTVCLSGMSSEIVCGK